MQKIIAAIFKLQRNGQTKLLKSLMKVLKYFQKFNQPKTPFPNVNQGWHECLLTGSILSHFVLNSVVAAWISKMAWHSCRAPASDCADIEQAATLIIVIAQLHCTRVNLCHCWRARDSDNTEHLSDIYTPLRRNGLTQYTVRLSKCGQRTRIGQWLKN